MKRKGNYWSGDPGSETRKERKLLANMAKRKPTLTRKEEGEKRQRVQIKRYGPPEPKVIWWLIEVHQSLGECYLGGRYDPSYSVTLQAPSKRKAAILRDRERRENNQENHWGGYYFWDDDHRICIRKQEAGESYLSFIQRFELELYGAIRTRSLNRGNRSQLCF